MAATRLLSLVLLCQSLIADVVVDDSHYSVFQAVEKKYRRRYEIPEDEYDDDDYVPYSAKKETICIYTRDNICLSTNVYTPTLALPPYDVLYAKTPYGKNSLDADAVVAEPLGWVFLAQDCRGRGQSKGDYSFWRTSGNDTLDTMEWVLSQKWSTGNIAMIGVSANALAQYADLTGVTQFPPGSADFTKYDNVFQHLRIGELFLGDGMGWHTVYQGGAYRTGLISGWLNDLHESSMIKTVQENEQFNEWWYPLSGPYQRYDNALPQWSYINQTIIHFAGFYDIFSTPQIQTALAVNKSSQIDAEGKQILIVDPGGHCPLGEIAWPFDLYGWETIEYWGIPAVDDAFAHGTANNMSNFDIHEFFPFNVMWYQLGPGPVGNSNGNYWIEAESFPPAKDTKWYLGTNEALTSTAQSSADSVSFVYDPKDPVKTKGGNNLILQPCGPWNQNSVERGRKDILHFNSSVLSEDIALVGELKVQLFVESDAVDTDFTAKLIDIHPNGDPYLVQDGILRMRWREAATWTPDHYQTTPSEPMKKGTVYNITIDLAFMSFIFNKGHRISLSVSSSNYERFSLNYNSGNFVIDGDKGAVKATNTVHFGGQYPSAVILPVVELEWLEKRRVPQAKIDHVHETVTNYYKNGGKRRRRRRSA